jgi:type VI protein secretion system component VasF
MSQESAPLQNLLAAVTEAILADEQDLDSIISRYAVPRAEVEGLVHLIQRLHVVLVGVRPSRRFAQRLRQDLMGQHQRNVINRLRYLPPRVQIAAGIALIAGFMLISRRRFAADTDEQPQEVPALR